MGTGAERREDAESQAPAGEPDTGATGGGAGGDEPTAPAGSRTRRYILVLLGVAAVAYALDLISKLIVVKKLEYHAPIDILGDWLQFRATRNAGAAFGMGQGLTIVLTVIASAVIVVILRLARKLNSLPWAIALGLLLGGALGNLTDRIFRSPSVFEGHVVDFIAPKHFAIFNLADSAIVVGGCLIVLLSFLGLQPDGTREGDDEGGDDEGGEEGADEASAKAEAGRAAGNGVVDAPAGATRASAAASSGTAERAAEDRDGDHAVESGPDAGHTRIS
ncbi:signal peptidase II [Embleya scabrispora]|uniref:Lipoprotein signal peptidase n=1 Tax=Embleya scabrispora TaxID=159449 RepID=A0A1T3P2H6_9ACTN|nr:signal peptidase II [Embleya scabrispora]